MQERLAKAEAAEPKAKSDFEEAQADLTRWYGYSRWLAILMAAMLIGDAILLPGLVRRQNIREAAERATRQPEIVAPDVAQIGTRGSDARIAHAIHRRDRVGEHSRRRISSPIGR